MIALVSKGLNQVRSDNLSGFTESAVEEAALAWLERLGWSVKHGLQIAPGEPGAERADYASRKFTRSMGAGAPA